MNIKNIYSFLFICTIASTTLMIYGENGSLTITNALPDNITITVFVGKENYPLRPSEKKVIQYKTSKIEISYSYKNKKNQSIHKSISNEQVAQALSSGELILPPPTPHNKTIMALAPPIAQVIKTPTQKTEKKHTQTKAVQSSPQTHSGEKTTQKNTHTSSQKRSPSQEITSANTHNPTANLAPMSAKEPAEKPNTPEQANPPTQEPPKETTTAPSVTEPTNTTSPMVTTSTEPIPSAISTATPSVTEPTNSTPPTVTTTATEESEE